MRTDNDMQKLLKHLTHLRAYDDDISILIRLKMIEELNMQIKNIMLNRRHTDKEIK